MNNNQSSNTTDIVGVANLAATKAPVGTLVAGETGQYVVTVTNSGPTDVPGGDITVTDNLPNGIHSIPRRHPTGVVLALAPLQQPASTAARSLTLVRPS